MVFNDDYTFSSDLVSTARLQPGDVSCGFGGQPVLALKTIAEVVDLALTDTKTAMMETNLVTPG
jgi:hypothetical protein